MDEPDIGQLTAVKGGAEGTEEPGEGWLHGECSAVKGGAEGTNERVLAWCLRGTSTSRRHTSSAMNGR